MVAIKFTNQQLTVAGIVAGVGGWYLLRKLGSVAETVIDETVDAASSAVEFSQDASKYPFEMTQPSYYGLSGDAGTFGTKAWAVDWWSDLWVGAEDRAKAKAKADQEAPDVYFNDSDIPQVW